MSVAGITVLIGAEWTDDNGPDSGSAYIFEFNGTTWEQKQELQADGGSASYHFGASVSASGGLAVIGERYAQVGGTNSGAAYAYRWNGGVWVLDQRLLPDDGRINDRFGISVAATESLALVGASGHYDNGIWSGAAYVFDFGGPDCNGNGNPDECDIAGGTSQDANQNDVPDECDPCVTDAECDDALFCTGPEECDPFVGCRSDTPPCDPEKACDEIAKKCGADCNYNEIRDACDIGCGPPGGSCDVPGCGKSEDCDGNGVPDECEPPGWQPAGELLPLDGASSDEFGDSVSVAGDVAVIGAPRDDDNGSNSGSAYVFRWNGMAWTQEQKLLPSDGAYGDGFGNSVSVSGDVAVIGTPFKDDNGPGSGAAYVFRWSGVSWVQEQLLLPEDGDGGNVFGVSVSVSGDLAVVGADHDDDNGQFSGSTYVFRWNGKAWMQEQKLVADDGALWDRFGESVSVSGDVAVVGAPYSDDNGSDAGSAYVFRWNGAIWVQEQELLAVDGATIDFFGSAVSVSGNMVVVGAPRNDDNGSNSGSAYAFRFDGATWVQEPTIVADDGAASHFFGTAVSVSGDVAVIGANRDDDNGAYSGSAYTFRWNGANWLQEQKLLADDGMALDSFGDSVSVYGELVVIGAYLHDENGNAAGSAYVFDLSTPDCNDNGILDECDVIGGTSQDADGNGVPDECQPCFDYSGCDDGLFCNGYESCDPTLVCASGPPPCGPEEMCNEDTELCVSDCNGNGTPDDCDIDCGPPGGSCDLPECGLSDDCTNNGIPDECEPPGWQQAAELLAFHGRAGDTFGDAVSVSGDVAVIGAQLDRDFGSGSGAAYVFRWNGTHWLQEQKLRANDGATEDRFGCAVSVSGDVAVIGAYRDDGYGSANGAAYVFRFDGATWVQQQKLLAADAASINGFGYSVAVSDDVAVIGVDHDSQNGSAAGSAYAFRWTGATWVQQQKLFPDDPAQNDEFGKSVSVSGDVAVIGARKNDDFGINSGSAYVFRWNGTTWVQEQKLLPDDGAAYDEFGNSVSVFGELAVIGARWDDDNGEYSGSAYVFRWDGTTWAQERKLLPDDGAARDEFGYSVSVSRELAAIGARWDDDNGEYSGSAYVFRWTGVTWVQEQRLLSVDGASSDFLGASVSVSRERVVIGASRHDDNGSDSGSAYVFDFGGPDCNGNELPDECDIDEGSSLDANGNGVPDECDPLPILGDCDGDVDVDLFDFDCYFSNCVTGSGGGVPPGCEMFDFDADADLLDWSFFQTALSVP